MHVYVVMDTHSSKFLMQADNNNLNKLEWPYRGLIVNTLSIDQHQYLLF